MTPDLEPPPEGIPDWSEGVCAAGIPVNGVDPQAERRAHMREQTMARQAAERRSEQPASGLHSHQARREAQYERVAALHEELASIDGEHQAWLAAQ